METNPFAKIGQIGVVVRDLEKAIKHYESLGIGPFRPLQTVYSKRTLWGKPIIPVDSVKIKVALGQMGPVEVELMQPIEGDSHWQRFLDEKGEGIQHLGFFCDNIERWEAEIARRGFNIIYTTRRAGGGVCYFETGVGGILLELIERSPVK